MLAFDAVAQAAIQAGEAKRDVLECDICVQWQQFVVNDAMSLQVGMTTATARE